MAPPNSLRVVPSPVSHSQNPSSERLSEIWRSTVAVAERSSNRPAGSFLSTDASNAALNASVSPDAAVITRPEARSLPSPTSRRTDSMLGGFEPCQVMTTGLRAPVAERDLGSLGRRAVAGHGHVEPPGCSPGSGLSGRASWILSTTLSTCSS